MFRILLILVLLIAFLYFAAMIFACCVGFVGFLVTTKGSVMIPLAAILTVIILVVALKW